MRPLFDVSLLAVTWVIGWVLLRRVPRLPAASSLAVQRYNRARLLRMIRRPFAARTA